MKQFKVIIIRRIFKTVRTVKFLGKNEIVKMENDFMRVLDLQVINIQKKVVSYMVTTVDDNISVNHDVV